MYSNVLPAARSYMLYVAYSAPIYGARWKSISGDGQVLPFRSVSLSIARTLGLLEQQNTPVIVDIDEA